MSNNQKPNVTLLTKSKGKQERSNVIEYIQSKDSPTIPRRMVDGIFVSLLNGEKYKINRSAIKTDIDVDQVWQTLESLGVPANITDIEIILDIDEAEDAIIAESSSILDKVFTD
jgi:hypothetical protein